MITTSDYFNMLKQRGNTLGEIRKKNSDMLMDIGFKDDISYRKVYILSKDGWKYEDARYQKHAALSILRDEVDYYLQFRPNIHYPIGTYVFIPDDTSYEIGFEEENPKHPFFDKGFDLSKLWIIVNRNHSKQFVRYNVLPCNWNFQWISKIDGKKIIMNCYGIIRSAQSYTSGVWAADRSTALDNITGAWLPDVYRLYGDKMSEYDLYDTRYIAHELRFMLTNNIINPKIYEVTKVVDLSPQGIIKLTLKQDEYDQVRDNKELLLCDFYDDSGEIRVDDPEILQDETKTSVITWMFVDDDGELIPNDGSYLEQLHIGKTSYFNVDFSDDNIIPEWRTELIGDYTDEERIYYEKLLVLTKFDNHILAVKAGKANSLIGKTFKLIVQDHDGLYESYIELEVLK